jgi:hypothetical protein
MRNRLLIGAGVLIVLVGAVWTLQGIGVIGGSVMTGKTMWAVIGPIAVVAGLLLALLGRRGLGRAGERTTPADRG